MTRAREWQVSLDFKARLDEDAAFDLMEALGRYGASVAVDPGHTGGGLTLAVDAPDGETALAKARKSPTVTLLRCSIGRYRLNF